MPGVGGSSDFFLEFRSNAADFSAQLVPGLTESITQINALREALTLYEAQAARLKTGGASIGLTFTGLDEATARMERATKQLAATLAAAARLSVGPGTAPAAGAGQAGTRTRQQIYGLPPDVQARVDELDRAKRLRGAGLPPGAEPPQQLPAAAAPVSPTIEEVARANAALAASATSLAENFTALEARVRTLLETTSTRGRATAEPEPPAPAAGGAGGGPLTPPTAPTGSAAEPEEPEVPKPSQPLTPPPTVGGGARDLGREVTREQALAQLDEATQRALLEARRKLANVLDEEARREIINQAGGAFLQDPRVRGRQGMFRYAAQRATFLADVLGLDSGNAATRRYVRGALRQGGPAESYGLLAEGAGGLGAGRMAASTRLAEQMAAANELIAQTSGKVGEAFRLQYAAIENLIRVQTNETATAGQVARAQAQVLAASRRTQAAVEEQQPVGLWGQIAGRNRSFGQDVARHAGWALQNTIAYTLVFSGFEKLRELVHTGLESQAAFVRLQASLDATGKSAGNLRSQLEAVSSATGTPLETVIEAASELAGVFKTTGEVEFATNVAAQLANISQGTLTAKEAAIGLRDVTVAYGLSGTEAIQEVGDHIARLSQLTGVSVRDITEGTTQIAQEARQFGLSQRQASTLAAYASQATGETGEASAYQLSRMLSSLWQGRTQTALTRMGVATQQQFNTGRIGDVLQSLMQKWNSLNDAQKNTIASLMGSGIQARIFAALMTAGAQGVQEMNNAEDDSNALLKQNQAYMNSIAGRIKQLSEDFQNFGAVLMRLGAFDFFGVLVKQLDNVARTFRAVFGEVADILNANPVVEKISHWGLVIGETVAAWKLLGVAASATLGKFGSAGTRDRITGIAGQLGTPQLAGTIVGGTVGGVTNVGRRIGQRFRRVDAGDLGAEAAATEAEVAVKQQELTLDQRLAAVLAELTIAVTNSANAMRGLAPATEETVAEIRALGQASVTTAEEETVGGAVGAAGGGGRGALLGGFALGMAGQMGGQALSRGAAPGSVRQYLGTVFSDTGTGAMIGSMFGLPGIAAGTAIGSVVGMVNSFVHAGRNPSPNAAGVGSPQAFSVLEPAFRQNLQALRSRDPAVLQKALDAYDKQIADQTNKMKAAMTPIFGKGDADQIAKDIDEQRKKIDTAMQARVNAAKILGDVFSSDQIQQLNTAAGVLMQLSPETLRSQAGAVQEVLSATGAPTGSQAYKHLQNIVGPEAQQSMKYQLQEQVAFYDSMIKATRAQMDALGPGSEQYTTLQQQLDQETQSRDAAMKSYVKFQVDSATSLSQVSAQQGDYKGAITQLRAANQHLEELNANMQADDPQYYANLQQIYDNRIKIAQLEDTPALQQLAIQLARTTSPLQQAKIRQQQAATQLRDASVVWNAEIADYERTLRALEAEFAALPTGGDMDTADRVLAMKRRTAVGQAQGRLDTIKGQVPADVAAAQANKVAADVAEAQTEEAGRAAMAAANAAGIQNSIAQLQAQRNEALRQETVYRAGQLQDEQKYAAAVQQENTLNIQIANALQSQAQSQYDLIAAQQTRGGDIVGAAQTGLAKANQAYAYALSHYGGGSEQANQAQIQTLQAQQNVVQVVQQQRTAAATMTAALQTRRGDPVGAATTQLALANRNYAAQVAEYGRGSVQAMDALAQVYQQQQTLLGAQLDRQNAAVDREIAQLQARGAGGDLERAAQDQVKKAQNALRSYLGGGGRKYTAEYDRLVGEVYTAQRNAFDVALQAQLDTLDFQRETYQITSAQEVQALQQILKNKQLTLKEQRDITLKIKDLQQSIREQLTQGGMNISSDIKLPTAYEVRRSLGAGFAGTGTTVSMVSNNNQRIEVSNNYNVPTKAVADQIAVQVVNLINQQTDQQMRANTSTPRLVTTR